MVDSSSNSGTEVIKMTCKLEQAKAREGDQGLLSNSDVAKQKFKELRKFMQKKEKLKKSGKAIQFIKENNDARAKLIEKLKEEACRTIKEVMTAKGTDEEDKLNNNDDLKDPAPTSKGSKNKPGFTKSAVSTQSSSYIQAQFTNSTFTGKPSSSTSSWFRLTILFYQDSATLMSMLKCKNTDMVQSELKCHTIKVSEKDKVIHNLKIQFMGKQGELAVTKKKAEKAE